MGLNLLNEQIAVGVDLDAYQTTVVRHVIVHVFSCQLSFVFPDSINIL